MQTPKVWGECGTYRLTRSAWAHSRPEGPQSQEHNRHSGAWGWGGPTNARFLQLFPFFRFLFVCLFSISSDAKILFVGLRVVVVVIILFLKTNHIWSCFSADTGTRGGDEADTNMRQAGRAPEGGWAPNTNSVRRNQAQLSLQRGHWSARAVEMYILPLAVAAVPHTGLFGLAGTGSALAIDVLCEADVGDACRILANDVHVRVQDGGVDRLAVLGQQALKVESVEIHPFDQVAQSFRLK